MAVEGTAGRIMTRKSSDSGATWSAWLDVSSGGFTQSLAANGWCKMPNGLIMQWGEVAVTVNAEKEHLVTLPMAFPSAAYLALANVTNTGKSKDTDYWVQVSSLSLTTAGFYTQRIEENAAYPTGFRWIALGR